MPVAGDEHGTLALSEREQVVVAGVGRAAGRFRWIRGADGALPEEYDELMRRRRGNARPHLRVGKRARELGEQRFRDDELEVAGEPARDDLRRRAAARKECGNQDVRVEDGAHSAPAVPCLVLGLDGERERFFFAEVVRLPELLEEIEAEFAATMGLLV